MTINEEEKKLTLEEKLAGLSLKQTRAFYATYQNLDNDIKQQETQNILPITIEEGKDKVQFYFNDNANFYARKEVGNKEINKSIAPGVVNQLKYKLINTYIEENYNNPHNWKIHIGKIKIEGIPEEKKEKIPKVLINYQK